MLICGQSTALALQADTVKTDTICHKTDTICHKTDSVKVEKEAEKKNSCCSDTTVKDHDSPYHKIVKEGGSMRKGLFTVRHIKDDWYLEVPDELLGKMLLAVTRFVSVPQDFRKFSGEEVNRSAVYFERYNEKTLFLREYVQSSYAKPDDRIAISLKQSTVDPIIQKFEVIGRNPDSTAVLIKVTPWLMSENKGRTDERPHVHRQHQDLPHQYRDSDAAHIRHECRGYADVTDGFGHAVAEHVDRPAA